MWARTGYIKNQNDVSRPFSCLLSFTFSLIDRRSISRTRPTQERRGHARSKQGHAGTMSGFDNTGFEDLTAEMYRQFEEEYQQSSQPQHQQHEHEHEHEQPPQSHIHEQIQQQQQYSAQLHQQQFTPPQWASGSQEAVHSPFAASVHSPFAAASTPAPTPSSTSFAGHALPPTPSDAEGDMQDAHIEMERGLGLGLIETGEVGINLGDPATPAHLVPSQGQTGTGIAPSLETVHIPPVPALVNSSVPVMLHHLHHAFAPPTAPPQGMYSPHMSPQPYQPYPHAEQHQYRYPPQQQPHQPQQPQQMHQHQFYRQPDPRPLPDTVRQVYPQPDIPPTPALGGARLLSTWGGAPLTGLGTGGPTRAGTGRAARAAPMHPYGYSTPAATASAGTSSSTVSGDVGALVQASSADAGAGATKGKGRARSGTGGAKASRARNPAVPPLPSTLLPRAASEQGVGSKPAGGLVGPGTRWVLSLLIYHSVLTYICCG